MDAVAGTAGRGGVAGASAAAVVPNRPDSKRGARELLARPLDGWGVDGGVIDDARLRPTGLMSNAVRHGSGHITLRIGVEAGAVEVRVHDDGPDAPQVKQVGPASVGGRGLFIVECLADQWGSDRDDPGKSVWFRLATPSASGD